MGTTVEVGDEQRQVVRIKTNKKDTMLRKALEQILKTYIEDHGENHVYPIGKIEEKS